MRVEHSWRSAMGAGALCVVAVCGAIGCSTYSTYKDVPLDCTVDTEFDFDYIDTFDTVGGSAPGWTAADGTAGASITGTVETVGDGARCGNTAALVIRAAGNKDWGALFGFNNVMRNEAAYEGMSFWARAPGNTGKGFTIVVDDLNTAHPTVCTEGVTTIPPQAGVSNCTKYCTSAGGQIIYGPDGMPIGGSTVAPPAPDACGNSYSAVVVITMDWRFYTIPFSRFQQTATPNRLPNGAITPTGTAPGTALLTSDLRGLILRMPKESSMELWIDNLGFYRPKAAGAGGNGGS
jgi:hypothetical protein